MPKGNMQFYRVDKSRGSGNLFVPPIFLGAVLDPKLKNADKVLLIYLLSKNENWYYRRSFAARELQWSENQVKTAYTNLVKQKYIKTERKSNAGTFIITHHIYENPHE